MKARYGQYAILFLLLLSGVLCTSFLPIPKPVFTVKTVVIDAGHGGKDPGCHGIKYKEKDIALAVALKLGNYIEEHLKDVKVVYTRKTDVFVELQERAEIANKAKADLFICIHCNSACVRDKKLKRDVCNEDANGAETYVMGIKNEQGKLDVAKRENSAILLEDDYVKKYNGFDPNSDESYIIMSMFTDTYLLQSLSFAQKLQKQYSAHVGRADKGVKRASLWVLWRTFMPSVLTEIGFLTNPEEEQFLGSKRGQEYVASAIFRAFREYKDEIEGTLRKYNDAFEVQVPYKWSKEDSIEIEENKKTKGVVKVTKPDEDSKTAKEEEEAQSDTVAKPEKEIKNTKPDTIVKPEKETKETKSDTVIKAEKDTKETPVKDKVVEKKEIKMEIVESPVIYKVQILSSDKKIPLNSEKLKNVETPGEYMDKGIYKYTSGEFVTKEEAAKLQAKLLKNGFKDAFIIATRDGKRITAK